MRFEYHELEDDDDDFYRWIELSTRKRIGDPLSAEELVELARLEAANDQMMTELKTMFGNRRSPMTKNPVLETDPTIISVSTITFETNETEDEVIERVTNDPNVKRIMSGDE